MFYSHQLLARKAPLGQIWMAATMHAKINGKKLICEEILNPSGLMACYSSRSGHEASDDDETSTDNTGSLTLRSGPRPITAQMVLTYSPNMKRDIGSKEPFGIFIPKGINTPLTESQRRAVYKMIRKDKNIVTLWNPKPFTEDDFQTRPDLLHHIQEKYYPIHSKRWKTDTPLGLANHVYAKHGCLFVEMDFIKYFHLSKHYSDLYIEPSSPTSIARCIPSSWSGKPIKGREIYRVLRDAAKTGLQIVGAINDEGIREFREARVCADKDIVTADLTIDSCFVGNCTQDDEFLC